MLCRKASGVAAIVFTMFASQTLVGQTTIFEDTFESYGVQNPAPDPLGPWTYSGPGGGNSSRTFQPGAGAGADTGSIGWISNVDASFLNTTISLGALAGTEWEDGSGNLLASNVYTLSFMHAAETSNATRSAEFSYDISTLFGTLAFDSGGNGDGSQSLAGLADGGVNSGGSVGKSPERLWEVNFNGTGLTTGDEIDFQIGRVTGDAFAYFDDIKLIASDGNIMPPVVNTGSRIVYDNTLGSPLDQGWTGSELSLSPGVDADMNGRIDGVADDGVPSENHGPVLASTGDAAWQYNDDWTQDGGDDGLDNGTFIYRLDAATAANMNENGFNYAMTLENLGSDGGFLSIGSLSDGTTGLFGTDPAARTRWGIAASEVPVDGQLHDVTWTWVAESGAMTVTIDGNPASNVITGGTNALFGGSVPGGAVFTWGDNTAGNPNTALNLVHGNLTVVPEPSSAGLVLLGFVAFVMRRRR